MVVEVGLKSAFYGILLGGRIAVCTSGMDLILNTIRDCITVAAVMVLRLGVDQRSDCYGNSSSTSSSRNAVG